MYKLKIMHSTTYSFDQPVKLGMHRLYIRPREGHDIRIESSLLRMTPTGRVKWLRDIYGNSLAEVRFGAQQVSELSIRSEVILDHYETSPLDFLVAKHAVNFPFLMNPSDHVDLLPYQIPCFPSDTSILREWCTQFWQPGQIIETYVLLKSMNQHIVKNFHYAMREEPGVQRPQETLSNGSGSCRDFATLFIEACRFFGLAARFVSGYLHCPESELEHGSTHAWAEVYLPGAGWKGFDNTSGHLVGARHIATAVNRHPEAVPPVSGKYFAVGRVDSTMAVQVSVSHA